MQITSSTENNILYFFSKSHQKMLKAKLIKDTIIIILISFCLLVFLEVTLRVIFPEKSLPVFSEMAYQYNENYLISLKPNQVKYFIREEKNGGEKIEWKTNSHSFRGSKLRQNPKYRIMIYGDSNIQAEFSYLNKTFSKQLEKELNKKNFSSLEVINAGIIGFGPDQSLIRFSKEADKYKPNLVIFHIFADNDFGDIIRNRLFELDKNGQLVSTGFKKTIDKHLLPTIHQKFNKVKTSLLIVNQPAEWMKNIFASSQYIEKLDENREKMISLLQNQTQREYGLYKLSEPRFFSHFADHYDIDLAANPRQESSVLKKKLMKEVLIKSKKIADKKGIKLLVLIQPSVIDTTKNNALLNYEYLRKFPNYKNTNLTDAVEDICLYNNIDSINLFDTFMNSNPENLFFKAGDNHWNDEGQKLAAKEVAAFIVRHSMLVK